MVLVTNLRAQSTWPGLHPPFSLHVTAAPNSSTTQMDFLEALLKLDIFQSSLKAVRKHVEVTVWRS